MVKRTLAAIVAISGLVAGAISAQAEGSDSKASAADACLKAVNALGASMGQTEVKAPDGRTLIKFRLRTSGLDYDAICDAATGVVGDVTPHLAPPQEGAS